MNTLKTIQTFYSKTLVFSAVVAVLAGSAHISIAASCCEAPDKGREIASRADLRPRGDDTTFTMNMITSREGAGARTRTVEARRLTQDNADRTIFRFTAPVDVRDTAFLIWEDRDGENDMWMYLPAMRRTRRIAGAQKSDSFMGTVFSNADMERRAADKDQQELQGEEEVDGAMCWKVLYTPLEEDYQYSKYVLWIRQDCHTPVKGEFYDQRGRLYKRMTTRPPVDIDGISTVEWMKMADLLDNRETVIEFSDIRYDVGVSSSELTRQAMER